MITVWNRTETAALIKHAFDSRRIPIDELCNPALIQHIDSEVLDEAEAQEEPAGFIEKAAGNAFEEERADNGPVKRKLTKAEHAELRRRMVDTVGKIGQPGGRIQKVISVGMLSEGGMPKL